MDLEELIRKRRSRLVEDWLDGEQWAEYMVVTTTAPPHCKKCGRFHDTKDHVFATGSKGTNVRP